MRYIKKEKKKEKRAIGLSQWKLIWLNFKKHRVALVGLILVAIIYIIGICADFIAPNSPTDRDVTKAYIPPSKIHLIDSEGKISYPFIYAVKVDVDAATLMRSYSEDKEKKYKIKFFVKGNEYKILGKIPSSIHLFGVEEGEKVFILGADRQGRCLLSRLIFASRLSMSIGFLGVIISFVLAIIFGCLSGMLGGVVDGFIQRITELLLALPHIPLWMALAMVIPIEWSIIKVFFAITIILSMISWPGQGRMVRGKVLQLKESEYILAAKFDNTGTMRLILVYFIPAIMSHLIASITLAIPGMILGETALSFLGIGLQPPAISWGVLINEAQSIETIVLYPWLLWSVVPVIIVVLAFNFMGDGLRDATDPFAK